MTKTLSIPDEVVISKIYLIRSHKVMLDIDLAELYQVETKRLNEQVKRNADRFPEDFMFQLTDEEWESLRSQIATSKKGRGGRRYAPLAFTEHGVLMLSSVLNSERAVQVNIQIMKIYAKLKGMLIDYKDILLKLEKLEKKVSDHDDDFKIVFTYLKELLNPKTDPMCKVGFKRKDEKDFEGSPLTTARHHSKVNRYPHQGDDQPGPGKGGLVNDQQYTKRDAHHDIQQGKERISKSAVRSRRIRSLSP